MANQPTAPNFAPLPTAKNKKPRLPAVEYIRGISMLGVVGIHVGSIYMENPAANLYLAAGFEALTRFAVPIFFFISAFGLFYNLREDAFSYGAFLRRRFTAVLVPYIAWSVFYVIHDSYFYGVDPLPLEDFFHALVFGTTKYHLYFLVVLLWFYVLMPLFIPLVKRAGTKTLISLLVLQVAFDYWSSYSAGLSSFVYSLPDSLLKDFFVYRLNFWVLHYVFIFVLGGVLARYDEMFLRRAKEKLPLLTAFFLVSAAAMVTHLVWLVKVTGYNLVEATNTAHQLSPIGITYTIAASLFFFAFFSRQPYPKIFNHLLGFLGRHSYFVYLAHPLLLSYLVPPGAILSAGKSIGLYFAVITATLLFAVVVRAIGKKIPLVNRLTIGSKG